METSTETPSPPTHERVALTETGLLRVPDSNVGDTFPVIKWTPSWSSAQPDAIILGWVAHVADARYDNCGRPQIWSLGYGSWVAA